MEVYILNNNAPYRYKVIDELNQCSYPNGVKIRDNEAFQYFCKYYFQKLLSLYKIEQPEEWADDYMLEVIFHNGFFTIFDSKKFGVIPQMCTLNGYNVFYHPREAIVSNPLLPDVSHLVIDKDCVVVHLPEFQGLCDIVARYAAQAASATRNLDTCMFNTMFSTIFPAEDKAMAKTFDEMFDRVSRGEPAVPVGEKLFDAQGQPRWQPFQTKNEYLANQILLTLMTLDQRFNTEVGIPNTNLSKSTYLSDSEVNANNVDTNAKCALWLDYIKNGFERANKMFGLNLSIDFRFKPMDTNGGDLFATDDIDTDNAELES